MLSPVLALLEKRKQMYTERDRLELRLLDPRRLKARGSGAGRLMHEEKQRKQIHNEIPKLNIKISAAINVILILSILIILGISEIIW